MSALYSTRVTATGGRAGTVRSEDGVLELSLAMPKGLGGRGGATNPEQLFAAGYAACFENAILHVARLQKVKLPDAALSVTGTVGLSARDGGGFALSAALDVTMTGIEPATAQALVDTAHQVCPYSNAVRGNVDVKIGLTVN